jgi:LCP family protein required for cell wall assembly
MVATKPTAAPPIAARLRGRLPEPIRRRLPPWRRARPWVLVASGVAAVLVSTSAVWGLNLLLQFNEHPTRSVPSLDAESDFAKGPRNVLLLGSDSRAGLSPEQQAAFGTEESVEGQRSDTIILMHIDPAREKAVVIHFPRDLRVRIPGHGLDKINAAYEYGGPDLVVRTVKAFTGLPIHNYIEVNLAGFQDLVDALGGVRLCVDRPMHDSLAGLDIPRAGCFTFDGAEALAFVRARHVEGDFIPDFARIARQQQFMRAMLNRLLSVRALLDTQVIEEAVANVTTDDRLTGADLVLLGQKLRDLAQEDPSGASSLDFRVVPGVPAEVDGVSYVIADREQAEAMFRALREGRPLGKLGLTLAQTLPSPGVIKVRVLNEAASDEVAARVATSLRFAGFIVLPREAPPAQYADSQILFGPGMGTRMQRVLSYFSPDLPRSLVSDSILGDAEVAVVVGDDFERFETVTRP